MAIGVLFSCNYLLIQMNSGMLFLTVSNTVIHKNKTSFGGGIYLDSLNNSNLVASLINNMITDNEAISAGGGIYAEAIGGRISMTLTNNTISNNSSLINGGGIYAKSEPNSRLIVNTKNSIIWGNSAGTHGNDMYMMNSGLQFDVYVEHCNLGGVGDIFNSGASYSDLGGNISSNPVFINPGLYDYHLGSSSPCKDTGTNSAPQLPAKDFEGDDRVADGNNDGTATVDMGADEALYVFPWPMFIPAFVETSIKE